MMGKTLGWYLRCVAFVLSLLATMSGWAQPPEYALPDVPGIRAAQAGSLVGPDGVPLFEEGNYQESPRCLAHEFSIPGQGGYVSGSGGYVSGSVGGLVVGPLHIADARIPLDMDVRAEAPGRSLDATSTSASAPGAPAPSTLAQLLHLVPNAAGDLVILVADDFGAASAFTIPDDVFALSRGGAITAASLVQSEAFTHGALVLHHLNALIQATGEYFVSGEDPERGTVEWSSNLTDGARLIVQGVNLQTGALHDPIDTRAIAEVIGSAIEAIQGDPTYTNVGGYVVNMSWVLLPCATVEAFLRSIGDFASFEHYIAAMASPNLAIAELRDGEGFLANVSRILSWTGPLDPLFQLIHGIDGTEIPPLPGGPRIAFVAAAGNFHLRYQMLPADWPYVVGVGAPDEGLPGPVFSNDSEVEAPGAWFALRRELPWEGSGGAEVAYAGTSFATPLVALFTAVEIAAGSHCSPAVITMAELPGLASVPPARAWLADAAAPLQPLTPQTALLPPGNHCPY